MINFVINCIFLLTGGPKCSNYFSFLNSTLCVLLVQILLAGGDKLEMWHKRRAREARTALIAAMIYNPLFRQVATLSCECFLYMALVILSSRCFVNDTILDSNHQGRIYIRSLNREVRPGSNYLASFPLFTNL